MVATKSDLSLQELAKEPIVSVPQRYLRVDQEPSLFSHGADSSSTIPVLDMKQLMTLMDEPSHSFQLDKLHSICKEWGIFQLVNHGVSSSVMEKLKYEIGEFYKLPLEEKLLYKIRPGDVEGYGQTIVLEEDQKVDWADRFYMIVNPIHRRKPHLLPQLPSSLRDSLESYISELQNLSMKLFLLIAKALGIDKREVEDMFDDGMQSIRMTYYPPCPQPELVIGLTPHSDATGITILHQINGVEGFQVKRDGVWLPVTILPHALVINLGDILEILSNGVYQSIEHRVMVHSEKERTSIAMFFNPKFEAEVGPSASLLSPQNPPLFRRVGMEQYFKEFFSMRLNGKSFLEHMKIKNQEGGSLSTFPSQ